MLRYLQIATPEAKDVNSLLAWIVGVLASFIAGILIYLRAQNKERIEDLKNQIDSISDKYENELLYNKEEAKANIKLLTDTGSILRVSSEKLEKNSTVLRDNAEVLRNIKTAQLAIENQVNKIQKHYNNG